VLCLYKSTNRSRNSRTARRELQPGGLWSSPIPRTSTGGRRAWLGIRSDRCSSWTCWWCFGYARRGKDSYVLLLGTNALELLISESDDDYERDKYRVENDFDEAGNYAERKFDDGVNDVENFPDNAARWTGEQVGRVEDIPQDIEQGYDRAKWGAENTFDNAVQDVADAPEDIANWAGRKVGDVERFGDDVENYGDNLDNAYDQGRNEGRNDGW
jgi:hypothetical protein